MAPELLGVKSKFDIKSDKYVYGVIPWEIAASRCTNSFNDYQYDIIPGGIREIIPDETPTAFGKIIKKYWSDIPSDRPFSEEVVKMIQEIGDYKKHSAEPLEDSDSNDFDDPD